MRREELLRFRRTESEKSPSNNTIHYENDGTALAESEGGATCTYLRGRIVIHAANG